MEFISSVYRWVQERWKKANPLLRIVYILSLLIIVTLLIGVPFFASRLGETLAKFHPTAQAAIFMFFLVGWVAFILFGWERATRAEELKAENSKLKEQVQVAEGEEKRRHDESQAGVWHRDCAVAVPGMLSKSTRKTRFLTVLNFKGDVGKTTLAANLAACLGLAKHPLRVLLVDLDYQGTLGRDAVEPSLLAAQTRHNAFVNRLLLEPPTAGLLKALAVPMNGVPGVEVILANDSLAPEDFKLQARFFLDPIAEPRYQFRKHLHTAEVFKDYDLVIFDCPPGVTTSVVNAVVCSDYVLIPTFLDRGSIAGVPRIREWMRNMRSHCPAELLAVVACRAKTWRDRLANLDAKSFENLRAVVKSACGGDLLLKAYVADRAEAVGPDPGHVASLTPEGQAVFASVVAELRKRMEI